MRRLSLITPLILIIVLLAFQSIKSPHGESFELKCKDCHSTSSWQLDLAIYNYNHDNTLLPLEGQHQQIECRHCHKSLVFSQANPDCISCHTDIHYNTVGVFCGDCHTPHNWLVSNIYEIHQNGRFPLLGPHNTNECLLCHPSASLSRFEPLGVECIDCHLEDYNATDSPNHISLDYSFHCTDCHKNTAFSWSGVGINHDFFPLVQAHSVGDCFLCHTDGLSYSALDPDCYSCHQIEYNSSINPNHLSADINTDCAHCHTLIPDWTPASFDTHNDIYQLLGAHAGIASDCNACHINNNYSTTPNTCIGCHLNDYNSADDPPHKEAQFSTDCESCHSQDVWEPATFDHTDFYVLTGAHSNIANNCLNCHTDGYLNTPNTCFECHLVDYNQSSNPNHISADLSTDCELCHTTNPDWTPASFDSHNDIYQLLGAHAAIASDCNACHINNNYSTTPNTCIGCHLSDYNSADDPPHQVASFSTDCELCHTQNAWEPSTFDHDGQYFPIYSGEHSGEWDKCTDCHTIATNYALFSCIDCHEHNQTEMNDEHDGVTNYLYNSLSCFDCHPKGKEEDDGRRLRFLP